MTDAFFAVQQAVFTVLAANTNVQTLLGSPVRLYDHVPPAALFPYVAFGDVQIHPYDTKTETGFEHIVTLNVWSRYRGSKEAKDIAEALYDTLNRASLTVAGQVFLSCAFDGAEVMVIDEGLTTHAAVRFSIITQSA